MDKGSKSHKDTKTREELITLSYKLYNDKGYTLREAGQELNISHEQVRRYILIAEDRFIEDSKDQIAKYKKKNLKESNKIKRLALMEFERSREDIIKTTTKDKSDNQGGSTELSVTKQGRVGESSLLNVAIKAIDTQNKMLGIYQEEESDKSSDAIQELNSTLKQMIKPDEP